MKIKTTFLVLLLFAQFANAQWASFSTGNTNGTVVDFARYKNELYATGLFTTINGSSAKGVAKWDGSAWQAVGPGFPDGGHRLSVIDSALYLVRYEMQVDSNWVYFLDNGNWSKLGTGFYLAGANSGQFYTCSLYDVVEYQGAIYASGEFNRNGGQPIFGIAKWDGSQWSPLGDGLSGPFFGQVIYPHQMLVHDGKLLVAGNFTKAGGLTVNGVAAWDGSSWSAFGEGFNSTVYALGEYNGELYAGGDFTQSGGTALAAVAKWNGSAWESPGFQFQYQNPNGYLFVHSIEEIDGKLYIAGGFDGVVPSNGAAVPAGSIIEYDGQNINTLEGGANNDVEGLISYEGRLLVGGFFSSVGSGVSASKLAVYGAPSASGVTGKAGNLAVHPNPTNGLVNIAMPQGETWSYKLLNMNGAVVKTGGAAATLDLSSLPNGQYTLQIVQDNQVVRTSILKL